MKNLLITFLLLIFVPSAFAVTASPSATPTQTVEKIKNLIKENLTTTEVDVQKEIVGNSIVGYSGKVKTVGTKNLTIETEKDLLQTLITDETIINKGGTEIKTSSIAIGDSILIYGQKNKDAVFVANQVSVLAPIDEANIVISKSQVAIINNIDLKKKTFTLKINEEEVSYTLSKKNTVKLEDFKDGDTIFGITKKYQGKFSLSKAIKL